MSTFEDDCGLGENSSGSERSISDSASERLQETPSSPSSPEDWLESPNQTHNDSDGWEAFREAREAAERQPLEGNFPWPVLDNAESPTIDALTTSGSGIPFAAPRRHLRRRAQRKAGTNEKQPLALSQKPSVQRRKHQPDSGSPIYIPARPLPMRYARRYILHLWQYAGPERIRNILVAGHRHHGKTSLIDTLVGYQLKPTAAAQFTNARTRHQRQPRYTDTRRDELSRGMSLHLALMPLLIPNAAGISHLVTLIDSPGHADFFDEVVVGAALADAVLIVVDSSEGILLGTERVICLALEASLPMMLVLSQLDRLLLELRYPPDAVYTKLQRIIEEANAVVERYRPQQTAYFGPTPPQSNVLFASAKLGMLFGLADVTRQWYAPRLQDRRLNRRPWGLGRSSLFVSDQCDGLCAMLWGDYAYDAATGSFSPRSVAEFALGTCKRAFVELVLEPLYKAIALCAVYETKPNGAEQLAECLAPFGADGSGDPASIHRWVERGKHLLKQAAAVGPWALLRAVSGLLFAEHGELYATLVRFQRSDWPPVDAEASGTTVLVATHWRSLDGLDTVAVGRVCGREALQSGQVLSIQERTPLGTENAMQKRYVARLQVALGRIWYDIERVSVGGLVLLPQLYPISIMSRSFALTSGFVSSAMDACLDALYCSLQRHARAIYGIAVAPCLHKTELETELLDSYRLSRGSGTATREQIRWAIEIVSRTFPGAVTFVAHDYQCGNEYGAASVAGVICGPGELYLDVFLYDLRRLLSWRYSGLGWRCLRTNPIPFVVAFRETVTGCSGAIQTVARDWQRWPLATTAQTGAFKSSASHENVAEALHRPLLTLRVEPLVSRPCTLETEDLKSTKPRSAAMTFMRNTVRFIRPERQADDVSVQEPMEIPLETGHSQRAQVARILNTLSRPLRVIYEGLSKANRQGPLTHSPVQGVRFLINALDCVCGNAAWDDVPPCWTDWPLIEPSLLQVAHEAAWRALVAAPLQILEPCLRLQVLVSAELIEQVRRILLGPLGPITIRHQRKIPGTCFVELEARVPARTLVPGLEVALRFQTHGQACVQATADLAVIECHDCWTPIPGNPMDALHDTLELSTSNAGSDGAETLASWVVRTIRRRRGLPPNLRETPLPEGCHPSIW